MIILISSRVDLTNDRVFSSGFAWRNALGILYLSERDFPWDTENKFLSDREFEQSDKEIACDMVLTGDRDIRNSKKEYRDDYIYHTRCECCGRFLDGKLWNRPNKFEDLCKKCSESLEDRYGEVGAGIYKQILIHEKREREVLYNNCYDFLF